LVCFSELGNEGKVTRFHVYSPKKQDTLSALLPQ
jgi:hypothetical protein